MRRTNGRWVRVPFSRGSITALVLGLAISPMSTAGASVIGGASSPNVVQDKVPLPRKGAYFGAFVAVNADHTGPTEQLAQEGFEAMVGRKMAVDKEGYPWDEGWPTNYASWSRDRGRIMTFGWNAQLYDGSVIKWADVADGRYDADIDAKAVAIKAFEAPAFFVFNHEPENQVGQAGTEQDFIDAYRHVHDRFVADGVANLSYALVLMAYTFRIGQADLYYPGGKYVDVIGADGYNYYQCPGHTDDWTSFGDIFSAFHDYGVSHHKSLFVSEWGSEEDPAKPGRKGQWISDAAATLKTWPEVKVVAYYDNEGDCEWWVDSSQSSLNAFKNMGADPYFTPPQPPPQSTKVGAYASVVDFMYTYPVGTLAQGKAIEWLFFGPSIHTVTDNLGMGLFDSGPEVLNGTFTYLFRGAGNYQYACTFHPSMTALIKIPLIVQPLTGNQRTKFTVTWASASPPLGFVFDVRIQRPGGDWSTWQDGVTGTTARFLPDSGRGTYLFEARIRNAITGSASWYSDAVTVTVS